MKLYLIVSVTATVPGMDIPARSLFSFTDLAIPCFLIFILYRTTFRQLLSDVRDMNESK